MTSAKRKASERGQIQGLLLKVAVLVAALAAVSGAIIVMLNTSPDGAAGEGGGFPEQLAGVFRQFVVDGGLIVWLVLLPMSLIVVYLIAEHCLTIRRKRLLPEHSGRDVAELIQRFGLAQLEARVAEREDLVSVAAARAVSGGGGDWFRMRNLLAESLQDRASALYRRIEWLNLIGNVSPMVGLFGTVFGMIKLFNAIVAGGGQPQLVRLAEGISVALVTTFWGLFIAIPALGVHGVFRNRIESLVNEAALDLEGLGPEIKLGLERQGRGVAGGGSRGVRSVEGVVDRARAALDEHIGS